MNKLRKFWKSSIATGILFVLAAGLLIAGGIGSTRAALTAFSENRVYEVELRHIGIGLIENGERVDETHLLLDKMLAEGEELKLGKEYPEAISVSNRGTIDMYIRVSLYKYWLDADGNKDTTLSPELIHLNLTPGENWLIDEEASTPERTVLYYKRILPIGEESDPLSDILMIDPAVGQAITETREVNGAYTVITRTFNYNGYQFMIEAQTDGVQTHNPEPAILSAWGRKVTITDGILALKEGD